MHQSSDTSFFVSIDDDTQEGYHDKSNADVITSWNHILEIVESEDSADADEISNGDRDEFTFGCMDKNLSDHP